ncbi:Prefoldin subunit 6 [Paramyrothecium foliicola]|nr:Prefoldin subunit 6 [Paramyrothecium foliicola]
MGHRCAHGQLPSLLRSLRLSRQNKQDGKTIEQLAESSSSVPEPNADSPLLQAPVEIVLLIMQGLPVLNELLLAQTCRALRVIVRELSMKPLLKQLRIRPTLLRRLLGPEEHLEFLSYIVRDWTDRWVCEWCGTIHDVCFDDTPSRPLATLCPFGTDKCYAPFSFDIHEGYRVRHNHVQLALKYARMGSGLSNAEKKYARDLTSHQFADIYAEQDFLCSIPKDNVKIWVQPKIIVEQTAEGKPRYRLLLRTTSQFTPTGLADIWRCRSMIEICVPDSCRQPVTWEIVPGCPSTDEPDCLQLLENALKSKDGTRLSGCSSTSPIDFLVDVPASADPKNKVVTCLLWIDMGCECPSMDTAWDKLQHLSVERLDNCMTFKAPWTRGRSWKDKGKRIWVCKRYGSALLSRRGRDPLTKSGQEFETIDDDETIYKLVGPVLLKQDKIEAESTVKGRLDFIGSEISRLETTIKETQEKIEKKKTEIIQTQSAAQAAAAGGNQKEAA